MNRRGSPGRLARPLRARRRRPKKVEARKRFTIPGVPDAITARLVDLKDDLHLEPKGQRWLARALIGLGLVDSPGTRRRAR